MTDAATYERRIARLEEELAACAAQAETAAINHEQSGRAMEERFTALSEEHDKLAAAKQKLQLENSRSAEEVTETRAQLHSLNAQLVRKDALIEEKAVQIETLRSEKRALDKQLEHRQEELAEVERRLKAAQASIVELTGQNTKLDAEAHEARAAQRRTELDRLQLQQLNENLQRNNKWLEENLTHLSEALKSERQKASQQSMELEGKLQQSELRVSFLEKGEVHLKARLQQKEKAAEDAQHQLKTEREDFATREQQFEKELATAQKLAALYKGNSEKRSSEAAELSNVVRDLRKHVEEMTAAHQAATAKLEEAVADAEKRYAEEKGKCQRMLEAAASGQLPIGSQGQAGEAAPSTPGGEDLPSPRAVSQMSKTQIYVKYAEATNKWKEERLRNRQNEILLDSLCTEMERKAVLVREQQSEYERVQAAYAQMSAALEGLKREKRNTEATQLDLEAQIRRDAKKRGLLEQQIKDLGRQVAVLLNEQQRRGMTQPSRLALPAANGSGKLTAQDIVSDHLVTFASVQELQDKNQKQLAVIRELSQQLEDNSAELKAELEAEKAALAKKAAADLEHFRQQREEQEELVQQIARQRDMFRKLLQDAANNPSRAAAADLQLIAAVDARTASNAPAQAPGEPNYQQLYADLEKELEAVRKETAQHRQMLREEASKAKTDAAAARADAARARADASFERQRAERQAEYLEEQLRQVQEAAEHSSKAQGMILALQERLSGALAESQAEQQKASALENKVHRLEMDSRLSSNAEQRLAAEVSQLSSEKHAREAELVAERTALAKLEEKYAAERARLSAELAKARSAETDAAKDLQEAQKRARDAVAARDLIQERADERAGKLEAEAKKAREAESEALQAAATAQGKAEVLQKALQKAEERAATFEFQANSRTQPAGGAPVAEASGSDREAQLSSQVKLLQEELSAAYEKAAQATSHVSQYQALAESSDQALKAMQAALQADHATYKAEADKHVAAAAKEAAALKEQLEAARAQGEALAKQRQELESDVRQAKEAGAQLEARFKEEIGGKDETIKSKTNMIKSLERDGDFWRQKFNSAEERAQREVMAHAETIKQLQAADKAKTMLDNAIQEHIRAREAAEAKLATAEREMADKASELTAVVDAANRKRDELEQQNKLLHEQLDKMARQLPGESDNDMFGVVSYLRHQNQVLEEEKQLLRHECDRLRAEINGHKRTIDSLNARVASDTSRQDQSARDEALFEERRKHQADLNMVKESNAALRSRNTELEKQDKAHRAKIQELQRAARPVELEVTRLKAEVESLEGEVKLRAEEAEMWEKRVHQLQEKYGKVDLQEYRRVEAELKALQASTKDFVPRAELAQAEARIKEVETVARGRVSGDFHKRTVDALTQQAAAANKALADEKARAAEDKARNASEMEGLRTQMQEQSKNLVLLKRQDQAAKRNLLQMNPTKMRMDEWKARQEALVAAEAEKQKYDQALQGVLPSGSSAEALATKLQADQARIKQLENQLKTAAPEVLQLQAKLADCQRHGAQLEQQLKQSREELSAAAAKLVEAESRAAQLQGKVSELEAAGTKAPEIEDAAAAAPPTETALPAAQQAAPQETAEEEAEAGEEPGSAGDQTAAEEQDAEMQEEGEADGELDEGAATEEAVEEELPAASAAAKEPAAVDGSLPSAAYQQPVLESPQIPDVAESLPDFIPVGEVAPPTQAAPAVGPSPSEGIPVQVAAAAAGVVPEAVQLQANDFLKQMEEAPASAAPPAVTPVPAAVPAPQQLPRELRPQEVPQAAPEAPQQARPVFTPASAAPGTAVTLGTPPILDPNAVPFQAGSSPLDMMAMLRQRALEQAQSQTPAVTPAVAVTESLGKRQRTPDAAQAEVVPPKRAKAEEEAQTAEAERPAPQQAQAEDAGAEEDVEPHWAPSDADDEQEHEEGMEEEEEREEEEVSEAPATTPAASLSKPSTAQQEAKPAEGAAQKTPDTKEGEEQQPPTEDEEKPAAESSARRSTRRKQKPTPIEWPGAKKEVAAGQETSPSQPQGGRGERPTPSGSRGGLIGRGRGRARRGRRGSSSAE